MAAASDIPTESTEGSREYRLKLPLGIRRVLEAQYQVHGRDEEEVILEVLGEWARRKRAEAEFIVSYLKS